MVVALADRHLADTHRKTKQHIIKAVGRIRGRYVFACRDN